nr:MAG TPA: hypothetical protein [Caudoviricetes sp.]
MKRLERSESHNIALKPHLMILQCVLILYMKLQCNEVLFERL